MQAGEIALAPLALNPATAAELFQRAVSGLKGPGVTVAIYRTRLAALVRVFAAGLAPPQPAARASRSRRSAR
ncbi:MAG: hypothetical protein ABI629_07060 [bacterium]